jgi:hypothetical protein
VHGSSLHAEHPVEHMSDTSRLFFTQLVLYAKFV